jgi:hypothetical protein
MHNKSLIVGTLAVLLCGGTAFAEEKKAAACDVAAAMDEAKAAKKKAASVGGEWRDTGKFLKKAEKAAASGDCKKANKLIAKVKFQAEAGHKQALAEAKAGNPAYLSAK